MSVSAAARRFARLVARRPSAPARQPRLSIEPLEDRAVPANSIFIADHATPDTNISVSTAGATTTIATTDGSAILSLTTLENALKNPAVTNVIVTTDVAPGGTDQDEFGDIDWDESTLGDSLDFANFGSGKTLTFRTVAGASALGNINLTAVHFLNNGTDDQINLVFDTSAADGIVTFGTDGIGSSTVIYSAEAVNNLTVNAGLGDFVFHDDGFLIGAADAGGAVSISAGVVDISHQGGLTAGSSMTVTGTDVTLDLGTGLDATGDLSVTGTSSVSADTGALVSEAGALTVSGPTVTLSQMILEADGDLTVAGSGSVEVSTPGPISPITSSNGNIRITGGTVDLPSADFVADEGGVTISGTDVSAAISVLAPNGSLSITGTSSVALTDTTADQVDGTTITGGTVSFDNSALLMLNGGDVAVSGTDVTLTNSQLNTEDGTLALTGTTITLDNGVLGAPGNITITGPVTLGPGGAEVVNGQSQGTMTFTGPVDAATAGEPDLTVAAGTVVFEQSVGAAAGLKSLTIRHGNTTVQGNTLTAATITLFDPLFDDPDQSTPATLGIAGTVTGNIIAKATANGRGNLAPGGLNKVGTMTVRGDIALDGDFELDLAVTPGGPTDRLLVVDNPTTAGPTEGNITIGAASNLGQFGVGQAPAGPTSVVHADAVVTGQFANAPDGTNLLVGTDYVTVTYPGTQDVLVTPAAGQGKVVKGADEDGTLYTVTLTGPGTLVSGKDRFGNRFLVVRDATSASKLAISTKVNGSDDLVTFGAGILVNGALASLAAPKVNIGDQFRATGPVAVASFRDFLDQGGPGISLGGTVLNKTAITARNIFDDVTVGATLTSLKVAQTLGAPFFNPVGPNPSVTAPAIGTVTAKAAVADIITPGKLASLVVAGDYDGKVTAAAIGKFQAAGGTATLHATGAPGVVGSVGTVLSSGPNGLTLDVAAAKVGPVSVAGGLFTSNTGWDVTGGITSLTAGMLSANITAGFLGTVLVKGNLTTGLSGDIQSSTITLTGNDGTAGHYGIKSLTAKGTVNFSLFDVKAGNVGPVTVGRFLNSQLYLNYTPHDPGTEAFNTGGTFGAGTFKLSAFKTTAVPLNDSTNPLNWAFANSEVAADTIGTVTLSGLQTDNGGTAFGIKIRTPGAVVKVLAADDPGVPLNVNLTPQANHIAGDFYLIDA